MVKMSSDCPEITKMILDIIYGDEGEGNGWKNKYEKCLEELKKESTRWWRF
jgi:hypothetical protein